MLQLRIWSYDRWQKPQQQQLGEVWRYDAFPNSLTEVNGDGHGQIPEYHNWEGHCRGNLHMDLGNLGGRLTPTKGYNLSGESADNHNHMPVKRRPAAVHAKQMIISLFQ